MERTVLHVDCNSFFASVETVFRPELARVPMAVAGDAEARHGIILAKNELAKANGVAYVIDKAQLLYIDPAQGIDLTPEARVKLSIPEGRTLETLQAELQAKAQAAQAAQAQ